jgi:hypothetical protein
LTIPAPPSLCSDFHEIGDFAGFISKSLKDQRFVEAFLAEPTIYLFRPRGALPSAGPFRSPGRPCFTP